MPDRFGDLQTSTFDLLPLALQITDTKGVLQASCQLFDDEILEWDGISDQVANSPHPDRTSTDILAMLWAEYGIDAPSFATIQRQREALFRLPEFLRRKGNPNTVRDMIVLLSNLSVEVVHLWNDGRWFRAGITKSGIHKAGIYYKNALPGSGPHPAGFVAGYAVAGVSPIGAGPVNEPEKMTIQLRLPRCPTPAEEAAIEWSIRYFARAVDIYRIRKPIGSKYWIVGQSRVGSDTKVKPCCWKAGISKAGITTKACDGPSTPPTTPITPGSPGTWVPWYNGGVVFHPLISMP